MAATDFRIEQNKDSTALQLQGTLDLYHAQQARKALKKILKKENGGMVLDVSGLTKLDTVGALLLKQYQETNNARIENLRPEHTALFEMVAKMNIVPPEPVKRPVPLVRILNGLGKITVMSYYAAKEFLNFFGQTCLTFLKVFRSFRHLRFADIMHHIEDTGIRAMPIISLMAFMIAVVIAYQAVAQLRPLGAERLTVNLVAISVLREMGVLLTAIMVAGRSGSAFTAEIGVMKVREEVDALQVIGMDPFEVLVLPRLIALIITLPLLTFLADMMGLLGGGVMSMFLINLHISTYMGRVQMVVHGHDFLVGMIKAPIFAFLIATVACMHGMKVSGSAESVGTETTASVVKSIFLVLLSDALFSVLFGKMGI